MRAWVASAIAVLLATSIVAGCEDDPVETDADADGDVDGDADADADQGDADVEALGSTGTVGDDCAPDDGQALTVVIGMAQTCTEAPGAEPQVHFYAYPGSTSSLAAGQSWAFDEQSVTEGLSAQWFPDGAGGNYEAALTGSLAIVSVSGSEAEVDYEFTTAGGETYAGSATVLSCPSTPTCG
jgi:hypothetical protein